LANYYPFIKKINLNFYLFLKLEMERALLDVEHNNELQNIQNDEAKLKHLQQEHQLRVEAFNLHTSQVIFLAT